MRASAIVVFGEEEDGKEVDLSEDADGDNVFQERKHISRELWDDSYLICSTVHPNCK